MAPLPARPPPIVLLIINDEERLALTALAQHLAGLHAIVASSIEQAFAHMPRGPPAAIVADIRGGSNHDWRRLRALQAGATVTEPLLVLAINQGDHVP